MKKIYNNINNKNLENLYYEGYLTAINIMKQYGIYLEFSDIDQVIENQFDNLDEHWGSDWIIRCLNYGRQRNIQRDTLYEIWRDAVTLEFLGMRWPTNIDSEEYKNQFYNMLGQLKNMNVNTLKKPSRL